MKTPLAWLNLVHDKARTFIGVAGVSFAVILVLMQLGFFFSVKRTATRLYDQLAFDVLLSSPNYNFLMKPGEFPRSRLYQAAALADVAEVTPLYVAFNLYRNPVERTKRGILVIGIDPRGEAFNTEAVLSQRDKIEPVGKVLIDRLSRPEYGPRDIGIETDVGISNVEIVGQFDMGAGFGNDGTLIVSDETFVSLFPGMTKEQVSLGLIKLRPGASAEQVVKQLEAVLPPDVEVFTRAAAEGREEHHWVSRTSVGTIFGLGVGVSLLVGVAIVYQVLASDIAKHMPEYATLKAMGYGQRFLASVVLKQALILALVGFLPGAAISYFLYELTEKQANIPMHMGLGLVLTVFVLSITMCTVSALASLRKLAKADPADLF